jgi:hypothetical protein
VKPGLWGKLIRFVTPLCVGSFHLLSLPHFQLHDFLSLLPSIKEQAFSHSELLRSHLVSINACLQLNAMGDMSGSADELAPMHVTELNTGWSFREKNDANDCTWLPVKRVPSTVHQDLIDNKKFVSSDPSRSSADRPCVGWRIHSLDSTRLKRNGWD